MAAHQQRRETDAGDVDNQKYEDFAAIRHRSHRELERTGVLKIGNCILGKRARRPAPRFRPELLRMREVERIIESRYGRFLPENDGDEFFLVIAHSLQVNGSGDVPSNLRGWVTRWAPWALQPQYADTLKAVAEAVKHRIHDLRLDAAANLLRVTMAEHVALRLRRIGACDVSATRRREIMAEIKRTADRNNQRRKRHAAGRKARDEWLAEHSVSRAAPWVAAGMSRASWYRRKRETGPSQTEDTEIRDTPVSTAATVANEHPAAPADGKAFRKESAGPAKLSPITHRAAKRSEAEGPPTEREGPCGDRYVDARLLYLRFMKPAHPAFTGSATEVKQAA